MKITKKERIIISIVGLFIICNWMMPLNQCERPIKEKQIVAKYGTMWSTIEMYNNTYYLSMNPKNEDMEKYPSEITAAFEIMILLDEENTLNDIKVFQIRYGGAGPVEWFYDVNSTITTKDYYEIKAKLELKNKKADAKSMMIAWMENSYYNRGGMEFSGKLDFLSDIYTRYNCEIKKEEGIRKVLLLILVEENNESRIEVIYGVDYINSTQEDKEYKTLANGNNFIGVMLDNNDNLWFFYTLKLEIYMYLGDDIWSEEPTDQLPDKSVIPPEIIKAYEYIYDKNI